MLIKKVHKHTTSIIPPDGWHIVFCGNARLGDMRDNADTTKWRPLLPDEIGMECGNCAIIIRKNKF